MLKIEKTLKEIEILLNQHDDDEMEWFDYKLYLINKHIDSECCIVVDALDSDETVLYRVTLEKIAINSDEILLDIIHDMYENTINPMFKFINGTKAFNSRKIKSIDNWDKKGNKDKVDILVQDLIKRHRTTNKMKYEVDMYKSIVSDMYKVLDKINPLWKKTYLLNYVNEKLEELGYDIEIDILTDNENMSVTIKYNDDISNIVTSSKIRKDELLEVVLNEIRGAR